MEERAAITAVLWRRRRHGKLGAPRALRQSQPGVAAMWQFFGKLHPVIVHFPIALIIIAVGIEYLHFRRTREGRTAPSAGALLCLLLGAAAAWVAAAAGLVDAETTGYSGAAAEILQKHRNLGLATAAITTVAAALALAAVRVRGRARFITYRAGILLAAALVSLAGHEGGKLIYGESYLSDAWAAAAQSRPESRAVSNAPGVDFNYQILPILTKRCFACHSGEKPESDFSLVSREAALKGGKSHAAAIVPGRSAESRLFVMISGGAGVPLMPPRGNPLSASELNIIKKWIDAGAPWSSETVGGAEREHWHWAYRAPVKAALPDIRNINWPRNAIDYYILELLEKEGLAPSPEADRATLLRRLSLDLNGVPPTVEELDAFLTDPSGDAYEKAVDRLLASPRFGERFARPWLDLARYADTQGYEKDARRSMWPWRDWVIDAFNADMPFDKFTIEQIAGDLLPDATTSQRIATGFHRNTMINEEGGVDPEEFRVDAVMDRVNTTSSVWLGSTIACAQCHHHKFDPVSMKEYYQLFAFFNNTTPEVDHAGFESRANMGATLRVPGRDDRARFDILQKEQLRLEAELAAAAAPDAAMRAAEERAIAEDAKNWIPVGVLSAKSAGGAQLSAGQEGDGVILASGPEPATDTWTIEANCKIPKITQIRVELLTNAEHRAGRAAHGNIVLNEFTILTGAGGLARVPVAGALADHQQGERPDGTAEWEIAGAIDGSDDVDRGWAIGGSVNSSHAAVLGLERPLEPAPGARLVFRVAQNYGGHSISKMRISVRGGDGSEIAAPAPEELLQIIALAPEKRTPPDSARLTEFINKFNSASRAVRARLSAVRRELITIPTGDVYTLKELPAPRETHIFTRGSFLNPGERVLPDVPAVFPRLPEGAPRNRLGLARWLVDHKNPLTARVQVNRWWSLLFGRAIVETEEDFGTRGDEPTHPKLLDWLAVEFVQRGWSMKSLLRTIVTSATYRQSSNITENQRERDPYNKLYSRGPRFRMEAEMLRDSALAISGLLNYKIGGPSVFPPQPAGLWTMIYSNDQWVNSTGAERYRRGIYTFWRRTSPYPTFTTFDAPTRETACTRRPRTNTPLQALTTLNDPQFVEAAVELGRRMDVPGRELRNCIIYGFRACTARVPNDAELARLMELYDSEFEAFRAKPDAAQALLKSSPREFPGDADARARAAAFAIVGNVLLNLDETLVNR